MAIALSLNKIVFTLHFATINTLNYESNEVKIFKFTLHFATINTVIHFTQYL